MAKRRMVKKEEEEEESPKEDKKPAFKAPEFDETEFLQTENRSAKLIYISLGTAVAAGIVTFGIMTGLHFTGIGNKFTIPLVVPLIFAFVAIQLFKKFGIDVKALEWKKWLENGFMFFMAWFAIWLLSMNPPFSDFADPIISEPVIEIEVGSNNTVHYIEDTMYKNDRMVGPGESEFDTISQLEDVRKIRVYSTLTDNWKLERKEITIQYRDMEGNWIDIQQGLTMNLSIDHGGIDFDFPDNVSEKLDERWLIHDKETRSQEMSMISFTTTDMSQLENAADSGKVDIRIIFEAEDSRENGSRSEITFQLDYSV